MSEATEPTIDTHILPATDLALQGDVTKLEEQTYDTQLSYVAEKLHEHTEREVVAREAELTEILGRSQSAGWTSVGRKSVSGVNVWEAVKTAESAEARKALKSGLSSYVADEQDVLTEVVDQVRVDMNGLLNGKEHPRLGPDVPDLDVGNNLTVLMQGTELEDTAVLDRATSVIKMLLFTGLYKFHKWGNSSQLQTALTLIEQYAAQVPGFKAEDAGLEAAQRSLVNGLAALRLDQTSKPNYQYAKPERSGLKAKAQEGLRSLDRTTAHLYLYLDHTESEVV